MQVNLLDLSTINRSIGRGVVMIGDKWEPGDALVLEHLLDTEGDIVVQKNPQMEALTTPELTGPAAHEMDYVGEGPVIEIPGYIASPALLARFSPTGLSSGGRSRRSAPLEFTMVIFPERLFLQPDGDGVVRDYQLELTGGVWTLDGNALTAAQTADLAMSFWAWRCVCSTPPQTFHGGAGDARKNIETVTVTLLHHPNTEEGHHLYTTGNPIPYGMDIEGGS